MSDNIEKLLKKEIKVCQEEDLDIAKETARLYRLLTKLPVEVRRGLQCFIYDHPLTEPLKPNITSSEDYD